jgi:uncharacterized protein YciI
MIRNHVGILATLVLLAGVATAAAAERETHVLVLVQYSLGPQWRAGVAPGEQLHFREHSANLRRLQQEGRLVFGARTAEKGVVVLRAESEATARAEIERDPAVQAGVFTTEISELRPWFAGCMDDDDARVIPR